jgi:hypothetical protein
MEKQQTLRGSHSGASSSRAAHQAQKSLATQPREGAPHRVLELRNKILARTEQPPPTPSAGHPDAPAPSAEKGRQRLREP